jgi:hypothetical protein
MRNSVLFNTFCRPGHYIAPLSTMALAFIFIGGSTLSLSACAQDDGDGIQGASILETSGYESDLEDPIFVDENRTSASNDVEPLPTDDLIDEEPLDESNTEEAEGDDVISDEQDTTGLPTGCGEPIELGELATCCDLGPAKCVPNNLIPEHLMPQLNACPEGGSCVPESVLTTMEDGGSFTPEICTSIAGLEGRCLSVCLPNVANVMALIPQDVCADDERCAPCIDPLSGEESGACSGSVESECKPESSDETGTENETSTESSPNIDGDGEEEENPDAPDGAQWSCENPPEEPILDVSALISCAEDAHCLPSATIPTEFHDMLGTCEDETSLCVPDTMSQYGGFFVPPTCESISGTEGRCLSLAIPQIAAEGDYLPISTCQPSERCSPCCDPFTGEETGACSQACDTGPVEEMCGEPIFPSCCNGLGHCVDPDLVPEEKKGNIKNCTGDGAGLMCVPDAMKNPDYAGEPCQGNSLLMGAYDGVCLPDCLKLFLQISYDASPCSDYHKCVPCTGPFGGSTDAPGCE